ncbi:hypothetical protein [Halopseudomonas pelagia]|uniref:hypothetical protein n=1 Tax=Halopseudomonas pelagia TaxID=553151 RepID=UPI0012682562|nr:hypothetical protein [Halopseudomonas pelagia]
MKGSSPAPLSDWPRDSSYGRLLRRLDQAMDMARTREWMAGRAPPVTELELSGLSAEDQQLLWRIIEEIQVSATSGRLSITPTAYDTCQQHHQHR